MAVSSDIMMPTGTAEWSVIVNRKALLIIETSLETFINVYSVRYEMTPVREHFINDDWEI